jgi:hypothetical protein
MNEHNETMATEYQVRTRNDGTHLVDNLDETEQIMRRHPGAEAFRRVIKTETTTSRWAPVTDQGPTILGLPMRSNNDAEAATVRDYLIALLAGVWSQGEGFSGKRPFGNSGWEYDLYTALGAADLIPITFDEEGFIDELTDDARAKGDRLIAAAIQALGR